MHTLGDLIGEYKSRQADIAASLAAGNAANWETYQRMIGHYAGLQEALQIIENFIKEDNRDDE